MKIAALIAFALSSVAVAGPVETCQIQSDYAKFTIEKVPSPLPAGVPDCPGCNQYKICLTLKGMNTESISHTCVKPPNACPLGDFNLYNATWGQRGATFGQASGRGSPAANDVPQCQYAQAGTYAYFLLKDGDSCRPPTNSSIPDYIVKNIAAVSPTGENVTVTAECRSRYGWETTGQLIRSCTGNRAEKECVWKVQAPTGDCDAPVVPYDIDCDQCAPLTPDCRAEVAEYPGYMSIDIANCGQPDALAALLADYGCEKSKIPNCNVIFCTSFVPSSVLADYDTMQCPILR